MRVQRICLAIMLFTRFVEISKVVDQLLGSDDLVRADDHLPDLLRTRHFVGDAHLRVGDAADDEDDQARPRAHLRVPLVFVPLPVAGTCRGSESRGLRASMTNAFVLCPVRLRNLASSQEGEMLRIKLLLDGILQDVLQHRHPSGRLIYLLVGALPAIRRPHPLAALLNPSVYCEQPFLSLRRS